jgi:dihydrodipicolinate synthase/N-acetylneuraminate lyase
MGLRWQNWPPQVLAALRAGTVIPAHPLALDSDRRLDPRRQRALARYYLDAGAGGLAVGVHTTQFAIREAGLFAPVLELAMRSATDWRRERPIMIAGLVGRTAQAVQEAQIARDLGYHAGLLSLAALKGTHEDELIAHAQAVAREIPLVGFYLQPAVGGLVLPVSFWRRFAEIENVVAIKIAPFNRYRTLDVVRGVVEAGAADRVTLYTGNDDHIVLDLLTPFPAGANGSKTVVRIKGGLLGHWSVWVKRAVELLERIHASVASGAVPADLLALDAQVTDCNAAIFDVANDFHGVIAGCHEILRRQGLLAGIWCLDPHETLGRGQREEIDRVCAAYPHLSDDAFVRTNLERWLS